MNILMFLSLFLSMTSALVCALVKQWCREFKIHAYPRAPPHKRGRVRTYLFHGLERSQMKRFIYGVHVALHISVFLFFWAVSDFLYNVYRPVGNVARYCLLTSLAVYMAFSISPLISINSPYHTALTAPLRGGGVLILLIFRTLLRFIPGFRTRSSSPSWLPFFEGVRFNRTHFLVEQADKRGETLDKVAMEWLLKEDDLSDSRMDTFLEALPGYIHSNFTNKERLSERLTLGYIIKRIKKHLLTCATSQGLSEESCIARVSACVNSLRLIFETTDSHPHDSHEDKELRKDYIQGLVNDLNEQCNGEDRTVALRASCVRGLTFQGLAFQGLLTHLTPLDVEGTPSRPFPDHPLPLYTFFRDRGNDDAEQQLVNCPSSTESPDNNSIRMGKAFLNDGPLVNLTLLADAILFHEDFRPRCLPLCWKTLDALLKGFTIAGMEVSVFALKRFSKVLRDARKRYQAEDREFRIMPLLEILNIVARGRHLSMVLLGDPKYHDRATVVFGKEQLQHSDLMEAFASCLPTYIDKIPQGERRKFMEDMIREDDLWTSLQVNLWNAVESRVPDKLRTFEACCTVIDVMFSVLEDSDMDWRAPEFGSLSEHFELFVTTCFKGTFVGRATGFRVSLIKLRFCDALLTQFREEVAQHRAVSLRSQWDVASLARVIYTLEVGDEKDVTFWKSLTSGGPIEADFIKKAREMLDAAIRDGPLLNFCKLGHLTVTVLPFAGSGLIGEDIKKVQEFQRRMLGALPVTNEHPPSNPTSKHPTRNPPSKQAWRKLKLLEREVRSAITKSSDEEKQEKEKLRKLLHMIEEAKDRCPFSAQELDPRPDKRSAQTPSHSPFDDDTSTRGSTSSQAEIRNLISSEVVNQVDVQPIANLLLHRRSASTWQPFRRSTAPANDLVGQSYRSGLTGPRSQAPSDGGLSSQSTSLSGPQADSNLPDTLTALHEEPESIDDQPIVPSLAE